MSVLVGKAFPDFIAPAVLGDGEIVDQFKLSEAIKGKYALLFFYPMDFTFVCPSEIIGLDHHLEEFKKRDVEVISISIDSQYTHFAWKNVPVKQGGIGQIRYTMVGDINHEITKNYGVEHPEARVAFRASFLIDKNGIIRAELINDLPIGRNIDEIIRLFDAIDFHELYGDVCPLGWHKGDEGMKATPDGVAKYLASNADKL